MKHKCMFYWFNLEHYRVHGLRDGIRLMLDFGINHYHWKWFDVRLQSVFSTVQSGFILSTVARRASAALYCYCAMLHYNHTVILFKRTQLMITLKAFRNEYSGSQAIKLIMVNMAVCPFNLGVGDYGEIIKLSHFLLTSYLLISCQLTGLFFTRKAAIIGCSSSVNQNTIQAEGNRV